MDALLASQTRVIGRMSRIVDNLRKLGKAKITKSVIQTKLEDLEELWRQFRKQDEELFQLSTDEDKKKSYFVDDHYAEAETVHTLQKGQLMDFLSHCGTSGQSTSNISAANCEAHSRTTLPKIDLPTFSGRLTDWLGFKELFQSLVMNRQNLTDVEKFHYLSSSLAGDAAQLVKRVPRVAANFAQAWDLLTSRYDNRRLLIDAQFENLHSIKPIISHTAGEFTRVLDSTCNVVAALRTLKVPVEDDAYWLVFHTVQKLDAASIIEWEEFLGGKTDPASFSELLSFLEVCIRKLGAVESHKQKGPNPTPPSRKVKAYHTTTEKPKKSRCALCQGDHILCFCEAFRSKSASDRRGFLTTKQLCFNCMGYHAVNDCKSSRRCQRCAAKHHTMIHDSMASSTATTSPSSSHHTLHQTSPQPNQPVAFLLATARVRVSVGDRACTVRALVDPCSEVSLVTESLVQRMNLTRSSCNHSIVGAGSKNLTTARGKVTLSLSSMQNPRLQCQVEALILTRLTGYRPRCSVVPTPWPHLEGLTLADPGYASSTPIDILLGVDAFSSILKEGVRRGGPQHPVAQETIFGWILSGSVGANDAPTTPSLVHNCTISSSPSDVDLQALVRRFWEQEEVSPPNTHVTSDEATAEDHFRATYTRLSSGRYQVRLPFRTSTTPLGESYATARSMLHSLERKFERHPDLRLEYCKFMAEYAELGHMQLMRHSEEVTETPHFHLPHHGVLKGTGATAKLRVVFNGSRASSTGQSLNGQLFVGPKLQQDLIDVLLRWRRHSVAFVADIEKMYRQIQVHPEDQDFQRILWRRRSTDPIEVYQLTTVTYGLACAPFLAIRTLQQLASDERSRFPLGSAVVDQDMYVDDVLSGASTPDAARAIKDQTIELFKAGGFTLRKWASNCPDLLSDLAPDQLTSELTLPWHPETGCSTLGLRWHPTDDSLSFVVKEINQPISYTKRSVLSQVASLFDPLGWLAPFTIRSKLYMQSLWRHELDWDTPLPPLLRDQWKEIVEETPTISDLRIPRWISITKEDQSMELHAFADASERAYATVVFLRTVNPLRESTATILAAKTKTAPLKTVSLPRLELNATLLAARLVARLQTIFQIPSDAIYLWTDSTITLAWLRGEPFRWKTFVANRVSEVQTTLPKAHFRHVPSEDNPADCASRGISATDLLQHPLWWHGPRWLTRSQSQWPRAPAVFTTEEETRPVPCLHLALRKEPSPLLHRFSSWTRLMRVTAWCRRWILLHRRSMNLPVCRTTLSPEELHHAETHWIHTVQHEEFKDDLLLLKRGLPLKRTSNLSSLTPFIDDAGLLRVGGRLKHSLLSPDEQHPIILPRNSHLTALLIDRCHTATLHGGTQLTLSLLRQRFWVPQGRRMVSHHIQSCIRCIRWKATTAMQQMGQLPASRVTPARPFQHVGVDYLGPIRLRASSGRGIRCSKGYVAVFICLSTKAVHLEVVSDYSTSKFLSAFQRLLGRRGRCETVTSDCGTNFVGADAELRRMFSASTKEHSLIAAATSTEGVKWKFIPPGAPHFGGLWEAAVKSVKHHMRRILGEDSSTYEEMTTFLCSVEACLNSRPLYPMTDDPEDLEALTPGHFLVGGPLLSLPAPSLPTEPTSRLNRWDTWQKRLDQLWQRWSSDYLRQLQPKKKWTTVQSSLNIGDLCLVYAENTSPARWPLARITAVHPGSDGLVRVVSLKTSNGNLKRPITKLIPLPRGSVNSS